MTGHFFPGMCWDLFIDFKTRVSAATRRWTTPYDADEEEEDRVNIVVIAVVGGIVFVVASRRAVLLCTQTTPQKRSRDLFALKRIVFNTGLQPLLP